MQSGDVERAGGGPARRERVLITGAAGRIGRTLREHLGDDYALRLLCHRTVLTPVGDEEVAVADVQDLAAVEAATRGVAAVVHLAANPSGSAPWEVVRDVNIVGTYNVFEAARRAGVPKIVFASTNHVTGWYEKEGVYTRPELPVRPDSLYGVSKAFGEALGRYYSDAFGLAVICLRIGSFLPKPTNPRSLATWLSPRDCAQLVRRSLASSLRFGIFYGISGNTRRYWEIESAQQLLGYAPTDDAESYAAEVLGGAAR